MQTLLFKGLFCILTNGQILKLTILLKIVCIYLFTFTSQTIFHLSLYFFTEERLIHALNLVCFHTLLWSITYNCSILVSGCLLSAGRDEPSVQSCCETQLRQKLGSVSYQKGIVGMYLRQCAWFRKKDTCLHREFFLA